MMPLTFFSCKKTSDKPMCQINGTIDAQWNGKKIFLVPVFGPSDASHVDSVVIEDGKFEFSKDSIGMYDIRMAWKFQSQLQDLLVITEPGKLQVNIAANSSAKGTRQNEILQNWKQLTMQYNQARMQKMMLYRDMQRKDSVKAKAFLATMEEDYKTYKKQSLELAKPIKKGALKDFFNRMFPIK